MFVGEYVGCVGEMLPCEAIHIFFLAKVSVITFVSAVIVKLGLGLAAFVVVGLEGTGSEVAEIDSRIAELV
jgi:hypothetical protein